MNTPVNNPNSKRTDIQVLRGIAVLLVMMYHAEFSFVDKGYLGVDIFFVLSGFLITRIILNDLDKGQFSFKGFYLRRARRLLPAAFVVFFFTSLLCGIFLSVLKLSGVLAQLLASLTFTANILFWQDTNYFVGASDLMPLLHVWSLSLEEQFYFVVPLVLFLTRKNYRPLLIIIAALLSFLLCNYWVLHDTSAAFFLLPARAWELLLGSVLASAILPDVSGRKYKEVIAVLCIAIIAFVVTVGVDNEHPRFDALLVCTATFVLIWFRSALLNTGMHSRALAKVGDISYSLYLVHWPFIAIAKNIWIDGVVPGWVYISLFLTSFPLAYLLYRFVEQPFRHGISPGKIHAPIAVFLAIIAIISPVIGSLYWLNQTPDKARVNFRAPNFGFNPQCEYRTDFVWKAQCSNSDKPDVLVWGDSYAMHLVPGLLNDPRHLKIAQATRSSCTPNLYMAQVNEAYNVHWARSCLAFNQSVLDYISRNNIKYVVMASRLNQFESEVLYQETIARAKADDVFNSYVKTLELVRQAGAIPVFIAPPPVNGADIGECLEKQVTGRFYISDKLAGDCRPSRKSVVEYQVFAIDLLKRLMSETPNRVVWPADVLCKGAMCEVVIDGVPLYRDNGHYSIIGSKKLVPQLDIFTGL